MNLKLTEKQWDYFNAVISLKYKECAYFGGFASGKSFAVMLCIYYLSSTYKNLNILYARNSYPELKDSVIKQFIQLFPEHEYGYEYLISEKQARFRNGSIINFRSFDKPEKMLSNEYDVAAICQAEEVQEELFYQVLGRLRGKNIDKNILLIEGNPASTWPKKRYKDNKRVEDIFFIEAKTTDNPFVSEEYVNNLIQNYPKNWIKRYVYGEWENYDEMVFNEFSESENIINPITIPKTWDKIIGLDYGFKNPTAIVWLSVDYDGTCYIFDEYYESERLITDIANASKRHGALTCIADYSIKSPGKDGRSIWTELLSEGLKLMESNKDKLANINLVNKLFKQKKLFIFRNCEKLIWEIKNYKWKRLRLGDEKSIPEEVVKINDHANDAMMYGLAYLFGSKSKDPNRFPVEKTISHLTEQIDYSKAYSKYG